MIKNQTNKKRILYIVTQGEWGGAQRYVHDLATNLADDFDVSVAVGEPDGGKELQSRITYHVSHIKMLELKHLVRHISPVNDILAIFELRKLYKQLKPDIIHLNSSKAGIIGSLAKLLYNLSIFRSFDLSIIYTAHGWVFNEPKHKLIQMLYRFLEKLTAKLKNKIIVLSDQDLANGIKLGIPKEKLVKIPLGIGQAGFKDKKCIEEILDNDQRLMINDQRLIVTIANLYTTKGLDTLIESIHLLSYKLQVSSFKLQVTSYKFFIIGAGNERPKLENLIKKYHLEKTVFLLGTIKNAGEYLPAFDLFILSSRKEGTPYTILEAMSASTPIISTTVGGIPSLLENKKEGILVEPDNPVQMAEAIAFALNKPEEMKKYAINAKNKITDFTLEKMVQNTSSLYNNS